MFQHLKKAKEENKQARIKGHKIEIDSVWYTAKELELSDRDTDYNTEGEEEEENTGDEETSQNSRGERGTSLRNTEGNRGQVGTRSAQQEKKRKAVVSPPIVHKKKVHKKKKH